MYLFSCSTLTFCVYFSLGSDGSSELTSPSPWGQQTPSPSAPWPPPAATPTPVVSTAPDRPPRRLKAVPRRLTATTADSLLRSPFAMKPLEGIRRYRRKLRAFRRKCRQPGADFKIGAFVLRMECQNGPQRTVKKVRRPPPPLSSSSVRLDKLLARLAARQTAIHVPITAWRPGRTDLANLVVKGGGPGSCPSSPQHGGPAMGVAVRTIKSELKMVTETCTLPVTSLVATSPRYSSQKVNPAIY